MILGDIETDPRKAGLDDFDLRLPEPVDRRRIVERFERAIMRFGA